MKPVNRLMLLGFGGLAACIGIAQAFKRKVSSQIKGTKLYDQAMDLLREHKGAKYLLGQPITESVAKYNSPGETFGSESEVRVLVSGPKSNGILFYTFGSDNQDNLSLNTVQLQIGKDDSKRLVIKKSLKEESSGVNFIYTDIALSDLATEEKVKQQKHSNCPSFAKRIFRKDVRETYDMIAKCGIV